MVVVCDGATKGKGQQVGERRVLAGGPVPESHCAIARGLLVREREREIRRIEDKARKREEHPGLRRAWIDIGTTIADQLHVFVMLPSILCDSADPHSSASCQNSISWTVRRGRDLEFGCFRAWRKSAGPPHGQPPLGSRVDRSLPGLV